MVVPFTETEDHLWEGKTEKSSGQAILGSS